MVVAATERVAAAGVGELADVVDRLVLDADGDDLRAAFGARDRLEVRLALAVAAFDAAARYEDDGDLTATRWLVHHAGLDPASATRVVRTGRRLRAWPITADAARDGRLSGGHVAVIVANVGRHVDRFADHEAELVPLLEPLTVDQTQRVLAQWRLKADALDDGPEPGERPDTVHLSATLDGRGALAGSLGSDLHALVAAALRVADSGDRSVPAAERRADALGEVCRFFLDHQQTRRGGRHRAHLNVVFTYQDLLAGLGGTYGDTGGVVSPAELGVLCCDSVLHRLVVDRDGAIVDYGRATRAWPVDLYNAISVRDQGCRWPGCDRPANWCDVHHVVAWHHGGATSLDNGTMLCRRHHRRLHSAGWRAKLLPDATLELTAPDGTVTSSEPRGPAPGRLWPDGG